MMRRYLRKIRKALRGGYFCQNVRVEDHVTLHGCNLLGPVQVGYRSYANDSLLRNVVIGRFCSIGRRCSIGAARHAIDGLTTHSFATPGDFNSDPMTRIGNDVWIGDNVVLIAGLTIGDGAVIGAGAVVTRDVDPYAIVAGVPARKLRDRFAPDMQQRLLASHWWDYGDAIFQKPSTADAAADLAGWDSSEHKALPPHGRYYFRPNS